MTERSYADLADSATAFDPETQFDADVEAYLTAKVIPFVPRSSETGKPMLEQITLDVIEQITIPKSHDDLVGNSVLHTVTDKQPA